MDKYLDDCVLHMLSGAFTGQVWAHNKPCLCHMTQFLVHDSRLRRILSLLRPELNKLDRLALHGLHALHAVRTLGVWVLGRCRCSR